MVKLPEEVLATFKDPSSVKIIATVDKSGIPNVTVKGSMSVMDDGTLVFADVGGDATRTTHNLKATKKVAILVTKGMATYQIKGSFKESKTSGPVFDQFAAMLKKAANINIKAIELITADEVFSQNPMDLGKKLV